MPAYANEKLGNRSKKSRVGARSSTARKKAVRKGPRAVFGWRARPWVLDSESFFLPKGLGGSDRRSRKFCVRIRRVRIYMRLLSNARARFVYRAGFYTLALLQGSFRAGAAAGCLQGELHGEPVALAASCSVATAAPDVAALWWRFWRQ